jgi:hypothetical protein
MNVLSEATSIAPDLADRVTAVTEKDFSFAGDDPLRHSMHNHVHLWMLEWWADRDRRIDLAFRRRVITYIFDRWKQRLVGYRPYREAGYRLYLYEDMAPTVSVVAETATGFPYSGEPAFTTSIDDVLRPYVGRSWRAYLGLDTLPEHLTPQRLLETINRHAGSIGMPVATALGTTRSEVRRLIEQWGLGPDVNRVRKHYRRRPALFRDQDQLPYRYKIYEERLAPNY